MAKAKKTSKTKKIKANFDLLHYLYGQVLESGLKIPFNEFIDNLSRYVTNNETGEASKLSDFYEEVR
ncbi:MAG: hypothetical protein ACXACY_28695 [Candidatus Hodarchaeales archaeon]|jgi:hypothetical protein